MEVAVLGSPSLTVLVVSVDVKQHSTGSPKRAFKGHVRAHT